MPRISRVVAVGLPHHVTQRGNYGVKVFHDEASRKKYLFWFQEYSEKYRLSVLAFCLMPNHVHFIVIPCREDSLARTFNTVHMRYSQYFNKKIRERGHLWQGRFYSCTLDDSHLLAAIAYVERNPVRAKLVKRAWQWKWSSASAHAGEGNSIIRLEDISELIDISTDSWKAYLEMEPSEEETCAIKEHTRRGIPWVSDGGIIEQLEKKAGRNLRLRKQGRPQIEEAR